jgi:polysaccharide biosynthesis transport protein
MELSYLLHALLKRKWMIFGATFISLIVAAIIILFKERQYESSAQYSTGFTIQQVTLVDEGYNPYETDNKFNNVLESFTSPKVIGMLSYNLLLHDLRNPSNPFRKLSDGEKKSEHYKAVDQERAKIILKDKIDSLALLITTDPDQKKLIKFLELYKYDYTTLKKQIAIERIPRTDYLSVDFKSENPDLSAYVVNKIGDEFLRFYSSLNSTLTSESIEKISTIVDQKKKQVDSITENLRREKATQGSLDPAELSKSAMQTVTQLNAKLADEKASYNKNFYQLQSVNNQLQKLGATPGNTNGIVSEAGGSNDEIIRLRTKLRELAVNKDDPKVAEQIRRLQDELRNREASMNGAQSFTNRSQIEKESLLTQKSDLTEQLKASDQTISYLNAEIARYSSYSTSGLGNDVKINALKSEIDIATKEYSDIKSKYMQAEGIQQTPNINFKQTLIGQPAVEPEPRHLLLILAITGPSMMALAALIIILLELLDGTIKSPSRFPALTGLNLLNSINKISLKKKSQDEIFNSTFTDKTDESLFIGFLRKLRYDIEKSGKKRILVTSTQKGTGKSVFIEALAHTLSLANKKVLIIDANFSNNSLTNNFGVDGTLEDFNLDGQETGFHQLKEVIRETRIKGVDIIGCKGGFYTPDEVLKKNNVLDHLGVFSTHYDYILLEGPALNEHSDSKELSRYTDGILAVFAADISVNQQDRESIQFLSGCGDQFMGSLLNKVESESIDI